MNGNNGNIVEAFQCANCGGSSSSSSSVKEVEDLTLNLNLHAARIKDLEAQVMILSDKATSAADKLADYEDELHKLRMMLAPPVGTISPPPPPPAPASSVNRIGAFLGLPGAGTMLPRSNSPPSPPPECTPTELELAKERGLREQAEERLQQVTAELEDLSASLFISANEMVAEERRARSKLEERVLVLERRDKEKRERLGVLERAVERIDRVREILSDSEDI